jgi:Bacterial regulatory proteins, luxR family
VRGYELACELAAAAVQRELEALARSARVPLASGPRAMVVPSALPGLTTREHEILGYLVAGSTYAEIANTLVISEKPCPPICPTCCGRHTPSAGLSWRSWLTALNRSSRRPERAGLGDGRCQANTSSVSAREV